MENLSRPEGSLSLGKIGLGCFRKRYFDTFDIVTSEISILAYDCLGLIYYYWINNKSEIKIKNFYTNKTFKGIQGEFTISKNFVLQNLDMYKISQNKFVKIN